MWKWCDCAWVYCYAVPPPPKGWLLLRRRNGVRIVSGSFSPILWWLGNRGEDMKGEQSGRGRRRGMITCNTGISFCSFQTPRFTQSGVLDLLKENPNCWLKLQRRWGCLCGNLKNQRCLNSNWRWKSKGCALPCHKLHMKQEKRGGRD